jgi:hypothetical protein
MPGTIHQHVGKDKNMTDNPNPVAAEPASEDRYLCDQLGDVEAKIAALQAERAALRVAIGQWMASRNVKRARGAEYLVHRHTTKRVINGYDEKRLKQALAKHGLDPRNFATTKNVAVQWLCERIPAVIEVTEAPPLEPDLIEDELHAIEEEEFERDNSGKDRSALA